MVLHRHFKYFAIDNRRIFERTPFNVNACPQQAHARGCGFNFGPSLDAERESACICRWPFITQMVMGLEITNQWQEIYYLVVRMPKKVGRGGRLHSVVKMIDGW